MWLVRCRPVEVHTNDQRFHSVSERECYFRSPYKAHKCSMSLYTFYICLGFMITDYRYWEVVKSRQGICNIT